MLTCSAVRYRGATASPSLAVAASLAARCRDVVGSLDPHAAGGSAPDAGRAPSDRSSGGCSITLATARHSAGASATNRRLNVGLTCLLSGRALLHTECGSPADSMDPAVPGADRLAELLRSRAVVHASPAGCRVAYRPRAAATARLTRRAAAVAQGRSCPERSRKDSHTRASVAVAGARARAIFGHLAQGRRL
jgi:hypothetical protein